MENNAGSREEFVWVVRVKKGSELSGKGSESLESIM